MPSYEFQVLNEETGESVGSIVAVLPVDQRDKLRIRRVTVPRSVSVSGAATPPSQGQEVLRGYRKQEEKLGSKFKSEFTPNQIKKAWAND